MKLGKRKLLLRAPPLPTLWTFSNHARRAEARREPSPLFDRVARRARDVRRHAVLAAPLPSEGLDARDGVERVGVPARGEVEVVPVLGEGRGAREREVVEAEVPDRGVAAGAGEASVGEREKGEERRLERTTCGRRRGRTQSRCSCR